MKSVVADSVKMVMTVLDRVVPLAVIAAWERIVAMEFATIIVTTTAA